MDNHNKFSKRVKQRKAFNGAKITCEPGRISNVKQTRLARFSVIHSGLTYEYLVCKSRSSHDNFMLFS